MVQWLLQLIDWNAVRRMWPIFAAVLVLGFIAGALGVRFVMREHVSMLEDEVAKYRDVAARTGTAFGSYEDREWIPLTTDQIIGFGELLRMGKSYHFKILRYDNPDAVDFADSLSAAFRAGSWIEDSPPASMQADIQAADPRFSRGIVVRKPPSDDGASPAALNALQAFRLPAKEVFAGGVVGDRTAAIYVLHRPR
jgi:hypothetical protein